MLRTPYKTIKRVVPIIGLLSTYSIKDGIADLIAGITIGLTLIPQSMACAVLAGLPPQYGLYSSVCGGFIYAFFGTVPELNIAPTALLSLVTLTYSSSVTFGTVSASVLLCFYAGIVEICCGLLHLGFLVDFVSAPAIAGLTSAAAILITLSQLPYIFGLSESTGAGFLGYLKNFFQDIHNISLWDTVLSICCCTVLLVLRRVKNYGIPPVFGNGNQNELQLKYFKIFVWFLSVSRNAIVLIISTAVSCVLAVENRYLFSVSGPIESGLPNISFPLLEATANNETLTLLEMSRELGTGIFVLPFIAIVSNIAIAKSFSTGKVLDASQEMFALGLCNLAGSLVGSLPVNGSFGRAAVSNASSVRTPFAGFYTGILVILSLTLLTPFFAYIPKAALASVVVCAIIFMVEVTTSLKIWKLNKIDALPLFITFFACLFLGVEIGVLIGIAVDVLLLLFYISRLPIDVQRVTIHGKDYVKIIPSGSVYYPSAGFFRERIMKNEIIIDKCKGGNIIIIDCSKLSNTDFTAAKCMGVLAEDLQKSHKSIAFLKLEPKLSKLLAKTCHNCIFAFTDDALSVILKDRRYSDILDSYKKIKVENQNILNDFPTITTKI